MAISDILKEQDALASHAQRFFLWPRAWQAYQSAVTVAWQMYRLATAESSNIPNESGIYTLVLQPGIADHPACSYLMYVGQTDSLRRRFREYLTKEKQETGRPKVFRVLLKYPDHLWFCFSHAPVDALDEVEDALIQAYLPPLNDQFPVEIRRVIGAF